MKSRLAEIFACDPGDISLSELGGGCINESYCAQVKGERFFVKSHRTAPPRFFHVEALGLNCLRNGELRIPQVIHVDYSMLVLEYLESTARQRNFDEMLGHGLASIHKLTSNQGFGLAEDGYCGTTLQPNGWQVSWIDFYGDKRLGHQIRLAAKRNMATADVLCLEKLVEKLPELLIEDVPALIHGDLWSGNLHVDEQGRPALVDPAAYYGHREAELGLMMLFGGFSERVIEAYDEAYPLELDWRERLPLYSLYHVLNHFNLFGGGYGQQAVAIAKRFL